MIRTKIENVKEIEINDNELRNYLSEVIQYDILTDEETEHLLAAYQDNKDFEAYEKLVTSNLWLVIPIAISYQQEVSHLQLFDLIQEGNMGLMNGIEHYCPDKGLFHSYIKTCIDNQILKGIDNKDDLIRLPIYTKRLIRKYQNFIDYSQMNGKEMISDEDFCQKYKVSEDTFNIIKKFAGNYDIHLKRLKASEKILCDQDVDLECSLENERNEIVCLALKEFLSPMEYLLIYSRFFANPKVPFAELAKIFHVTRTNLTLKEENCRRKLKAFFKDKSIYEKTIMKIYNQEGVRFNYLKLQPQYPTDIIKYLYLKDELSNLERRLYELNLLGKYNYSKELYAHILGIDLSKLANVENSLKAKIFHKFVNVQDYQDFMERLMHTYGSRIYNIDYSLPLEIIDCESIFKKYHDCDLNTIVDMAIKCHYELSDKDYLILSKFFRFIQESKFNEAIRMYLSINEIHILSQILNEVDNRFLLYQLGQNTVKRELNKNC